MRDWIVVAVLYVFGVCVFRFLGGLGSAGEALRRWGEASSSVRRGAGPSS